MSSGSGAILTPGNAFLLLISETGSPKSFPLNGLRTVVGRSVATSKVELDLTPQDFEPHKTSRRHAEFSWVEGHLYLQDLGSSNGTWINDQRLQGGEPGRPSSPHPLKAGDRVRLAHLSFEVAAGQETVPASPSPIAPTSDDEHDPTTEWTQIVATGPRGRLRATLPLVLDEADREVLQFLLHEGRTDEKTLRDRFGPRVNKLPAMLFRLLDKDCDALRELEGAEGESVWELSPDRAP